MVRQVKVKPPGAPGYRPFALVKPYRWSVLSADIKESFGVDGEFELAYTDADGDNMVIADEKSWNAYESLGNTDFKFILETVFDEAYRPAKRARFSTTEVLPDLRSSWASFGHSLPDIDALPTVLLTPLQEHEKIPISQDVFDRLIHRDNARPERNCLDDDLLRIFRVHDTERIAQESLFTHSLTMDTDSGTAKSFHFFWDSNICNIILGVLSSRVGDHDRNSDIITSTGRKRPDLILRIKNLCLFRGEEQCPSDPGDPKAELVDKLSGWPYGPAPYVFGYYAHGAVVTYTAILKGTTFASTPVLRDLKTVELQYLQHRIDNLVLLIRMSSLLPQLASLIGRRAIGEYMKDVRHNKTVEIQGKTVHKAYTDIRNAKNTVSHLKNVYDVLKEKEVPHVDTLVSYSLDLTPQQWPYVRTYPVGTHRMPKDLRELFEAISCILNALFALHSRPDTIIHRDIRWDNIMNSLEEPSKWFIIDWEHSSRLPTEAMAELNPENHCPTVFQANHGCEVDIWAVGRLLRNARTVPGYTSEIAELEKWMMTEFKSLDAPAALNRVMTVMHPVVYPLEDTA